MQKKLLLTYLALIVTTMVLAVFVSWQRVDNYFVDRFEEETAEETQLIKALFEERNPTLSALQAFVDETAEVTDSRITLIKVDGYVLADSDSLATDMDNHGNRPEFKDALAADSGFNVRFSQTLGSYFLYYAVPVETDDYEAVLRVSVPVEEIKTFTIDLVLIMFIGIAIGSVVAIFVAYYMTNRLMRPVNELTRVARVIADGNYDEKIYIDQKDQIGELAEAFNGMTHVLRKNIWELTRKNAELESILTSMGNGLAAVNNDFEIALNNTSFIQMLQLKDEDLRGKKFYEAVRELTIFDVIEKSIRDQEYLTKETTMNQGDEEVILQVTATPIFDREHLHRHLGALIILTDVTQIRKLESMRRDFVSNVTHELKTPLTSIRGFVDTLKNGAIKEEEVALRFLDIIDIETDRLSILIQDILALSEIETIAGERNVEDHDFGEILHEVVNIIPKNHEGVDLMIDIEEGLPKFTCNRNRIKQLMINLVDNSLKYTEDGHVKVSAFKKFGQLNIVVEDTGVGIGKEHLERIFERFYRVDKGRSRKMGGTGLGLSIVKHIVELYNGKIDISSNLGKGTKISIKLPYKS